MEEFEEQDMLHDMSGDHSGSYHVTATTDVHSIPLPGFLSYLSLGFKVISTVIIVLMASWVIITIRTTRSLHKAHNIFVAHLMFIDIMFAVTSTLLSGAMTIGYFTGVGDFIGCNVYIFMLYPTASVLHILGDVNRQSESPHLTTEASYHHEATSCVWNNHS